MVISNKFLNAAESALQERFIQKIFLELSIIFPDHFNADREDAGLKEIVVARKEGAGMYISTEKGIFSWVAVRHLLGDAFFEQADWKSYQAAAGRIGDYTVDAFLNALSELFSMSSPEDNGYGLSEAAFEQLPEIARLAAEQVIAGDCIAQLVGIEGARQVFLETTPTVITRNPYNAKIAELRRSVKTNDAASWKINQPLLEMNQHIVTLEVENINLRTAIDAREATPDEALPLQQQLTANEEQLSQLVNRYAAEQEKTAKQLQQIQEKNKGLKRQIEQLKVQRN